MEATAKTVPASAGRVTAWSPLRISTFRFLWFATLVSNVGTWMHDVGAGWLMTTLSPSPVMVALVQTATTLPVFLLGMPAGALSDIVDRRRYLVVVQVWMALTATALAVLTLTGITTAWTLLALTFALGIGTAMAMPAWAAVTPELVPREQLQSALALNSLGINVARAIGPALAGIIVAVAGTGAVFAINAVSFLGVILVLTCWRREAEPSVLPGERFAGALRAGFRFARHSSALQATVIRGFAFFVFASATWALLPLVARDLVDGGPEAFGMLVAALGIGAVGGAIVLPRLRERLSPDALVASASVIYAAAMASVGTLDRLAPLAVAMAISGAAWIAILSSLHVAAQMSLPGWVRSRGLAVFMTVFMGSMAAGSVLWGALAGVAGIRVSLGVAAVGLVLAVALGRRWRLSGIERADLSPGMHWPEPVVHDAITHDRGPVLVTLNYRVRDEAAPSFLELVRALGRNRRRDGAFAWGVFEDTERPGHFIESFCVESWLEHLRQHERVTAEDRELQRQIGDLLAPGTRPAVSHYVAPAHDKTGDRP